MKIIYDKRPEPSCCDHQATKRDLEALFSPHGQLKDCFIVRDPRSRQPKGFGFVVFKQQSDMQRYAYVMSETVVY